VSPPEDKLGNDVFQKKVTITCLGKNGVIKTFEARAGLNLWVLLRRNGLPIGAACSGVGVCAACDVEVTPTASIHPQVSSQFETDSMARNQKTAPGLRLACLLRVVADVTVRASYW
jgi:ferredoxin